MAMCILGSSRVFSKDYLNNLCLSEQEKEEAFSKAEDLFNEAYPEVEWFSYTSEVGVERNSLRAARMEFSIVELTQKMQSIWNSILV